MKIALIVSLLVTSLALNAQTLQGKVVRVVDGDMITILDGARGKTLMAHSNCLGNERGGVSTLRSRDQRHMAINFPFSHQNMV